jgi:hypothetical protein
MHQFHVLILFLYFLGSSPSTAYSPPFSDIYVKPMLKTELKREFCMNVKFSFFAMRKEHRVIMFENGC